MATSLTSSPDIRLTDQDTTQPNKYSTLINHDYLSDYIWLLYLNQLYGYIFILLYFDLTRPEGFIEKSFTEREISFIIYPFINYQLLYINLSIFWSVTLPTALRSGGSQETSCLFKLIQTRLTFIFC